MLDEALARPAHWAHSVPVDVDGFRARGYVVLPRLLDAVEVEVYTRHLETLSERSRASLAAVATAVRFGRGLYGAWTRPDGVSQHGEFWDVILNARLLGAVRSLLGAEAAYLPHSELQVGFSALNWHRDNVDRTWGVGPDWDESVEPYRLVRVAVYLQSFAESRFSLGLIPKTHLAMAPSLAPPGAPSKGRCTGRPMGDTPFRD
jgi:hypothetical protein